MKILLDTHAFLWFVTNDPQLSVKALQLIRDPGNVRLLSLASVWEMAIKSSIGKLTLLQPFGTFIAHQLPANRMTPLPISIEHTVAAHGLPLHHRDPFDRMLIAQAQTEGIPIVGADDDFDPYGVQRLW